MNFISRVISWELNGNTGFLKFTNPPGNVMNHEFFTDFSRFTTEILPHLKLNGIIISGSGRHFSSGADIEELLQLSGGSDCKADNFLLRNSRAFHSLSEAKIPVVAVIKGVCLGSAMELALACHYRFCAKDALMGFPETEFNLIPGCGGHYFLNNKCGMSRSLELILGGKNFTADEAYNYGIADAVADRKELDALALNFINSMKGENNSGNPLHLLKNYLNE